MLEDNWEQSFAPIILARGYEYFEKGRVSELRPTDEGWRAKVDGSTSYRVFVASHVSESTCECPYFADQGRLCKHIAAACYEIKYFEDAGARKGAGDEACANDGAEAGACRSASGGVVGIAELAESLGDAACREYLLDILRSDQRWHDDFVRRFSDVDFRRLVKDALAGVRDIVRENSRRGFVDYRNAYRCESALDSYLGDFLSPLVERGAYGEVLAVVEAFSLHLQRIAIDDSDGFFSSMLRLCSEYWGIVRDRADEGVCRDMLRWMLDLVEMDDSPDDDASGVFDLLQDAVGRFVLERFAPDDRFARDVEVVADRIVEAEQGSSAFGGFGFGGIVPYRRIMWTGIKVRCMVTRGESLDGLEEYVSACPAVLEIVQPVVDLALQKGEEDRAIRILRTFKDRSAGRAHPTQASLQLLKILDGAHREAEAREELFELVVCGRPQSDEQLRSWIRKLKRRSGLEWRSVESRLEAALEGDGHRLRALYAETGRLDDLAASFARGGGMWELEKYRDVLLDRSPELFVAAYEKRVRQALFTAAQTRGVYRENVLLMKKMREIPGGAEAVGRIVAELKDRFPRRRALMEELVALE